jgi:hypothetical protein
MPQLNITEDQLARVPFATDNRRTIYMDKKLKGFSVVVGKRSMAFYAQRDIKTKIYKAFLGRHGEAPPPAALFNSPLNWPRAEVSARFSVVF